jgi:hypothetical protein
MSHGTDSRQERFGSGTPGDQGTYSGVGAQPDGGGAGLGEATRSGTGSPQDIAEAQSSPQGGTPENARETFDRDEPVKTVSDDPFRP